MHVNKYNVGVQVFYVVCKPTVIWEGIVMFSAFNVDNNKQ